MTKDVTDILPKKVYKWPISTCKGAQRQGIGVKTTMRCHFALARTSRIRKSDSSQMVGEDVEKPRCSYTAGRIRN